ncbi:MAG: deoxyguanosinetriphosphate triphosphohydrolase [Eubacteriales bacterium]|nr:deoxyguanosinetriphosphate triphosphohydrolase [Eubacteriales bacterium]
MTIRERIEENEKQILSPYAAFSCNSAGRGRPDEEDDVRTVYMRDRDRILHCKSFRRMKDKTQVFLSPQGDHYRTRMTHTLEVSQIARTIGRALRLNTDLIEAIALGHDLGHTPFGHAGERTLNTICPGGFRHYEQSLRVVERLEKDGKGLNLTEEVRDGILNHQMETIPGTLEGRVVRLADKIAYIHHDTDDAMRAGMLREDDIPITLRMVLGYTSRERLNTLVLDIINSSMDQDDICMSPDIEEAMLLFRKLMFADVYTNPVARAEEPRVNRMLTELYDYYLLHPGLLPKEYTRHLESGEEIERVVCDYISGMTDQYCVRIFQEIYLPKSWDIY